MDRPSSAKLLLLAAGGLLVVSLWAGIVLHLHQVRETTIVQSRRDVANLSIALAEQVARLIESIDEILRLIQKEHLDPKASFDTEKWMNEIASLKNVASQIAIFDAQGDLQAHRTSVSVAHRPNVSDRDYFIDLRDDPSAGLRISRSVVGRLGGRRALILARSLKRPDGAFAGVFTVVLDPEALGRRFRALDMDRNGSIALIGADGFARVRSPTVPGMYELDTRSSHGGDMFSRLQSAQSGTFETDCVYDGKRRIFGYRAIEGYPLFLVSGKALDDVLASFRREVDRALVAGGLVTFVFLLLGAVLLRELDKRLLHEELLTRANKDSLESERRFRLLAEKTTDIIIWSDLEQRRQYVSPSSLSVLGYEPELLIGSVPGAMVHPDDWPAYEGVLHALCRGKLEKATTRQRYRRQDDSWVWIETSLNVIRDECGHVSGYVASLRDITARREAEEALRVSEERLKHALDSGSDGLWDLDFATGHAWVSDQWCRMLGYRADEASATPGFWKSILHPDDAKRARDSVRDHLKGVAPVYECEHRIRREDGRYVWVLTRGKVVSRSDDGRALRMVGTQIDISARKEAEGRIKHMALHDALTDLPNRTMFRERLEKASLEHMHGGSGFAVLLADLDQFKTINDTYGHSAGDALLRTIADRLGSIGSKGDTVARLGGDEFAIILNGVAASSDAEAIAATAIEITGRPVDIGGRVMSLGASIGIALAPEHGSDPDVILKNADIALYQAKAAGRHTFATYEESMGVAVEARNALELDLREAMERDEFLLHFQPILNVEDGGLAGFEALLRWKHPRRGIVSPAEFIPVAEETGLITQLGEWALVEACVQAAVWPGSMRIAVNVSAVQFRQTDLERAVVDALFKSGLPAERLELEITESVLMQDSDAVVASLHRLKALGVRIALDDFGTGFSSLSYLRRFPFDKIKIDRSFVKAIADPVTSAIVHAVVGLAKQLGATVTAEGVETRRQLELVRRQGCNEVQGYLYSKPLAVEDAAAFVRSNSAHTADESVA